MTQFSHYQYHMQQALRRWQSRGILPAVCLAVLFLLPLGINSARLRQEQQAAALAPHILRFHVLANSNSPADQQLKLEIRDLLLDTIHEAFQAAPGTPSPKSRDNNTNPISKKELQSYITEHTPELESIAGQYIQSHGFSYSARITLEQCHFPTKTYGNLTFPSGTYDAVRVILGEGKGRNWWCVLYPPLCFPGGIEPAETPEHSADTIRTLIPEEDDSWITAGRSIVFGDRTFPVSPSKSPSTIQIRCKSAEWLLNILK